MINPSGIIPQLQKIMRLLENCYENVCKKNGLSNFEASILLFLYNNPEKNIASDIVNFRQIPKANVSKAVESLIQKKLLTRIQDKEDRRRTHLMLTESAGDIIPDLTAAINTFFNVLFIDFTEEERELYFSMNNRIANNAERGLNNE